MSADARDPAPVGRTALCAAIAVAATQQIHRAHAAIVALAPEGEAGDAIRAAVASVSMDVAALGYARTARPVTRKSLARRLEQLFHTLDDDDEGEIARYVLFLRGPHEHPDTYTLAAHAVLKPLAEAAWEVSESEDPATADARARSLVRRLTLARDLMRQRVTAGSAP